MITEEFRKAWPYEFGLVYSVILSPESLETSLQVQNKGSESFDFHVLLHNYFKIPVSSIILFTVELALTLIFRTFPKSRLQISKTKYTLTKSTIRKRRPKPLTKSQSLAKPIVST